MVSQLPLNQPTFKREAVVVLEKFHHGGKAVEAICSSKVAVVDFRLRVILISRGVAGIQGLTVENDAGMVDGATVTSFVTEASTMLVIGLILSMFGIGLFCWLIFTLAAYALPFFIGLTAGMAAFHSGAGVLGALLIGIVTGAITLAVGRIAFAVVRPSVLRAVIAAAFAIPAAIAGYHAVLGLSQIGVPSLVWREVFAATLSRARLRSSLAFARCRVNATPSPRPTPSVPPWLGAVKEWPGNDRY
jgi:hypothetical protein